MGLCRGTRRIFTTLSLPSTSHFYLVKALDGSIDSVMAYNSVINNIYSPGQMRVYMYFGCFLPDNCNYRISISVPPGDSVDITCNMDIKKGGVFHVDSAGIARIDANVTVEPGGLWVLKPGATIYLGKHNYTVGGELVFTGDSSATPALASLLAFNDFATVDITSGGWLVIDTLKSESANVTIGANITEENGAQVHIHSGTDAYFANNGTANSGAFWFVDSNVTMTLHHGHSFINNGTLALSGSNSKRTTIQSDNTNYYSVITCGTSSMQETAVWIGYCNVNNVQLHLHNVPTGEISFCKFTSQAAPYACIDMYNMSGTIAVNNNRFTSSLQTDTAIAIFDNLGPDKV